MFSTVAFLNAPSFDHLLSSKFDVRSKKLFPDLLSGKSFPDQNESTNRNYLLLLHIIVRKNVVQSVALMYFFTI